MTTGLILTGAIIAICGYLVKYRRKEHWLAGYDASKVTDPKAVANHYGGHLLAMGLVGLIPGLIFLVVEIGESWHPYVVMGYAALVMIWVIWLAVTGKHFQQGESSLSDQVNHSS